ncbi:hypothetical protein F7725_003518 [Dissostichus mawsoni]|uniref:Small ribosomal subunit protein uS7 domain-containing protein n=1 Tax=Dissostichus mawsoni TaxID=36200 RepID=A0A7J5YAI3_DISMA|nr:hypothetical protein F7725_003518 [Dissostichus mawsoni]
MAASISGLLKPWTPRVFLVRWSRYNPYYLEPEVRKEAYIKPEAELSAEEKEQRELKALRPIKAATNDVTSSVFSDPVISKFVGMMMLDGNKILANEIISKTLENIKRKQVDKYHKAPEGRRKKSSVTPTPFFTRLWRTVPIPLSDDRRRHLAMKWLITECRESKHRRTLMYEKLSQELLAASAREGNVIKKKLEMHKMAEANRAYAHYRWA